MTEEDRPKGRTEISDQGDTRPSVDHVDVWVFDLDNTLYPAQCRLFDQVAQRIGLYIADLLNLPLAEAKVVQRDFFKRHGTTLRGLMTEHGIDPQAFLRYVHDIDVTPVPPNPRLRSLLQQMPGPKVVFTNGSVDHADRIMTRLGIADQFSGIFDIVASDFIPKPEPGPYAKMVDQFGITPDRALMFEDIPRNLEPAAAMGMTTVLVEAPEAWNRADADADYIDHVTHDLTDWLAALFDR